MSLYQHNSVKLSRSPLLIYVTSSYAFRASRMQHCIMAIKYPIIRILVFHILEKKSYLRMQVVFIVWVRLPCQNAANKIIFRLV